MRKKVLKLKEARPAIKNLIKSMKRKYNGRNINFESISTIPDDEIDKNLPSRVKNLLLKTPHVRKIGHESGIEFYYYKLKTDDMELYILPIILIMISRENNDNIPEKRLLTCSLDTFMPKIKEEEIEIDKLLDEILNK